MLSFSRLRLRIILNSVPHVQHVYFSSFNQSDHCVLALSLPLPSSLLKLSNNKLKQASMRYMPAKVGFPCLDQASCVHLFLLPLSFANAYGQSFR